MRRIADALLKLIPFDVRGRRAIDETLLDWAHEEALATRWPRRGLVLVRASAGLARTLAAALWLEVRGVPVGWLVGRILLLVVLPSILLTALTHSLWAVRMAEQPWWSRALAIETMLLQVPTAAAFIVTPWCAFFLLSVWQSRERLVPTLGLSLSVFVMVALMSWWVTPEANQRFRTRILEAATAGNGNVNRDNLARGVPELTMPALAAKVAANRADHGAADHLLSITGLPLYAAAQVLLGAAVSRQTRRRRILWTLLFPCVCIGVYILWNWAMSVLAGMGVGYLRGWPREFRGFAVWGLAALAMTAALALGRRDESQSLPGSRAVTS